MTREIFGRAEVENSKTQYEVSDLRTFEAVIHSCQEGISH